MDWRRWAEPAIGTHFFASLELSLSPKELASSGAVLWTMAKSQMVEGLTATSHGHSMPPKTLMIMPA